MGECCSSTKTITTKKPTASELQTYLMLAKTRLSLYRNKKVEMITDTKENILIALKSNNQSKAQQLMESVIRQEDAIAVADIIKPLCELLNDKCSYIMQHNYCPNDIRAILDTIIYASYRMDVDDLSSIRLIFQRKFGDDYITNARNNADGLVNVTVVNKLNVQPVSEFILNQRLRYISNEANVFANYTKEEREEELKWKGPSLYVNNNNNIPFASKFEPYRTEVRLDDIKETYNENKQNCNGMNHKQIDQFYSDIQNDNPQLNHNGLTNNKGYGNQYIP